MAYKKASLVIDIFETEDIITTSAIEDPTFEFTDD